METKEELNSSDSITLIMDGWKNVNSDPIINIVACIPKPMFIRSIMTGSDSHTAENMKELIHPVMENIGKSKVFLLYVNMLSTEHQLVNID